MILGPDPPIVMDEVALAFLHGSNAIEDITNIRYEPDAPRDVGHPGAFFVSQSRARAGQALSQDDLCHWQRLITEEQVQYGHQMMPEGIGVLRGPSAPIDVQVGYHLAPPYQQVPVLMAAWLQDLNDGLAPLGPSVDAARYVELLGDFFQRFEAIHPFVDGNGRTGRLVANYISRYLRRALLVFRADERPAFYSAHSSKRAMRLFMGQKVREAAMDLNGRRLELVSGGEHLSTVYAHRGEGPTLIVEWHELFAAEERWRQEMTERGESSSPPASP